MKKNRNDKKTGRRVGAVLLAVTLAGTTFAPLQIHTVQAAEITTDNTRCITLPKIRILRKVSIDNKNPKVGDVLKAEVLPKDAAVRYTWTCDHKVVGRESELPVTSAMTKKQIQLTVTGVHGTLGVKMDQTAKVTADDQYPTRNPYERVEAEAFDENFGEGMVVEDSDDGEQNIGGIKNGFYTCYRNVDFGRIGAESVMIRASASSAGGTVEIRLGSPSGKMIGSCEITSTGSWSAYRDFYSKIDKTRGVQDVYLVFTGGDDSLFNLNWFRFFGKPQKTVAGVQIDQNSPTVGDTLHSVLAPEDATVSYLWKADGEVIGQDADYTVSLAEIGKQIELEVTGMGNYKGTKTANPTAKVEALDYDMDFEQTAYDAFSAYIDNFYTYDEEDDVWRFGGFWTGAETYEIVVDAYEHTGDARYKEMIDQIYEGFKKDYKHQEVDGWWGGNDYNDDIMWITIATVRSYLATGDTKYLETAKINFDNTYARSWSDDLGGGLFWRVDNQTKNACVNGPGAIAACLLGEALDDESYFEKAREILKWERDVLFDPETGHIGDNIGLDGGRNNDASTYNQGTFIGASCLLYDHYGDDMYLNDAILAADYTMIDMYHYGVMNNEDSGGDLPGFKGIFTRWVNDLIVNHNQTQYIDWMQYNAWTAWNNRNSAGITKTKWAEKTEDSERPSSWSASAAVALYQNTPNSKDLVWDAFHTIGARDFDSLRGIITETENGMKYVGNIEDGAYTVYHNIDFGDVAPENVEFQVKPELAGGSIELHIGKPDGEPAAVLNVANAETGTRDIADWTNQTAEMNTEVTGLQTVYLVYRTEEPEPFKLNSFRFLHGSENMIEKVTIDSMSPVYRDTLTAEVTPKDADVSYIWEVDGVQAGTGKTYEVKEEDIGKTVTVTAIGEGTYSGMAASAPTDPVEDLPADQVRNPYEGIEAESADILEGPTASGGHLVDIRDGHYAVYKNLDFGSKGSTYVTFTYATAAEDASVEIHLGSPDGKLIGTCELPRTDGWEDFTEAGYEISDLTGREDLCLVFRGSQEVCRPDRFVFEEEEAAAKDAYQKIEAENADKIEGMTAADDSLTDIQNGGYAAWKNTRFGNKGTIEAAVTYASSAEDSALEFHLDSPDGPLAGTCELENTGGTDQWSEKTFTIDRITGRRDIYLVFTGEDGTCSLDSLVFHEIKGDIRDPYTTVEAEAYDASKGCGTESRNDVTYLAGIGDGAYSGYHYLDFGDEGTSKVTLSYASPVDDAVIDIYEGGTDGKLLGSCPLENTGDFWEFTRTEYEIEPVNGIRNIYLVYHGAGDICNMDSLVFEK